MPILEGCFMQRDPLFIADEQDGCGYTIFSASEATPPSLTQPAYARQGRRFVAWDIVEERALLPDGSMPPNLDKMRGEDTLVIARQGYGTKRPDDVWCTDVRLKSPEDYTMLPSFVRCEGNFFPGEKQKLARLVLGRTIQEAGALAGDVDASSRAMHAVFRKAVELALTDSLGLAEVQAGGQLAWLMGMVQQTHTSLSFIYGPESLQPIGTPTLIDLDERRVKQPLVPLVFYPDRFIGNLARHYLGAPPGSSRERVSRGAFLFFTERLRAEHMERSAWQLRAELRKQYKVEI